MDLVNKCYYETTKDSASNLIALINKYHTDGNIEPEILGHKVRLLITSSARSDFYNILPQYNFNYDTTKLNDAQLQIKEIIENTFFKRLKKKTSDESLCRYFPQTNFNSLIEISQTLKFSSKLFPLYEDSIIYIGIGSEKLGYYVMIVTSNYICDCTYPNFNLNTGFYFQSNVINDNNKSLYESNSNISSESSLNNYFNNWTKSGRRDKLLSNNNIT